MNNKYKEMTIMNDKYEIIDQDSATGLYRIRAIRDIPRHGVMKGDLGGLIRDHFSLYKEGDAWVGKDAVVLDSANVYENAYVGGHSIIKDSSKVFGNVRIKDTVIVGGNTKVYGDVYLHGNVTIDGYSNIWGNSDISGDFAINGHTIGGDANLCIYDNKEDKVSKITEKMTKLIKVLKWDITCIETKRNATCIGITIDPTSQTIEVDPHLFGRRTTMDDVVAAVYRLSYKDENGGDYISNFGKRLELTCKEAHQNRKHPWTINIKNGTYEDESSCFVSRTFIVCEDYNGISSKYNFPGKVSSKIHISKNRNVDKFKVTFADWWVLINTMPSVRNYCENFTAIDAATDPHYLAYELSNSEDKVTWYQKGEEPWSKDK